MLEINYYEEILFGIFVGGLFMLWAIDLLFPEENENTKRHERRDWGSNEEED